MTPQYGGSAATAFYTALDVLAGTGAGALQQAGAVDQKRFLFADGNDLAARPTECGPSARGTTTARRRR